MGFVAGEIEALAVVGGSDSSYSAPNFAIAFKALGNSTIGRARWLNSIDFVSLKT